MTPHTGELAASMQHVLCRQQRTAMCHIVCDGEGDVERQDAAACLV
jgi:hypothetical protein